MRRWLRRGDRFWADRAAALAYRAELQRGGRPTDPESSPGKWCRYSPLTSSVMSSAVQAPMRSTSLSLLSREISFSDPWSLRVAIDFWLM